MKAELFKTSRGWMCRFVSEPDKSDALRLLGADVIPTPFTAAASFEEVRDRLMALPLNAKNEYVEVER